jgi:hypothetical protein
VQLPQQAVHSQSQRRPVGRRRGGLSVCIQALQGGEKRAELCKGVGQRLILCLFPSVTLVLLRERVCAATLRLGNSDCFGGAIRMWIRRLGSVGSASVRRGIGKSAGRGRRGDSGSVGETASGTFGCRGSRHSCDRYVTAGTAESTGKPNVTCDYAESHVRQRERERERETRE